MNDIEEAHDRKVEAFKICCIIYKHNTEEDLEKVIQEAILEVTELIKAYNKDGKRSKINTEINRMISLVKFLNYLEEGWEDQGYGEHWFKSYLPKEK